MTRIQIPSQPALIELREVVRDHRSTRHSHTIGDDAKIVYVGVRERWCRTTTSDDKPSYPTFPANKFVIEFGDLTFDDTDVGDEAPVFVPYIPQDWRIALSTSGYYIPNTITRATLHGNCWYLEDDGNKFQIAKADAAIAPGDFGTVSIWNDQPHVDTGYNVIAYHTWMEGDQTIEAGTELTIWWFEKGRFYLIVEAECPT